MNRYETTTAGGFCRVTDTQTGAALTWVIGRFNETNKADAGKIPQGLDPAALAGYVARICRELADYAAAAVPELL